VAGTPVAGLARDHFEAGSPHRQRVDSLRRAGSRLLLVGFTRCRSSALTPGSRVEGSSVEVSTSRAAKGDVDKPRVRLRTGSLVNVAACRSLTYRDRAIRDRAGRRGGTERRRRRL
jgi:hypothetical protein